MAKQTINIGTAANDGTGDTLRAAGSKLNQNCDELYAAKTEAVANYAALPATGVEGKVYVTLDTGVNWTWVGGAYRAAGWNASGTALIDPVTGRSVVAGGAIGRSVTIPAPSNPNNPPVLANFDIFDLYRAADRRKLALPTPYAAVGTAVVHPSVVFIPEGWRGWRYWMAYTPYPNANSDYENPCIAVSNDGENWEVPDGLTNPIVPKPAGGYNADTHLVMAQDYSKLYLVYHERIDGVRNALMVMESSNGIIWTTPIAAKIGTYGTQAFASPSVWYSQSTQTWAMLSHNLDGGTTFPLQLTTTSGPDIYSGWGTPQAVTITNPTAGRTWWHSCFDRLPDGRIVGLVQDVQNGSSGAPGALFVAESLDGGSTFAVQRTYSDLGFYRPAFNLFVSADGKVGVTAWIGRQDTGGFSIHREDWLPGAVTNKLVAAASEVTLFGSYSSYWWFDNFNRADGVIGSPTVGSALTVDTGSFTISGNKLTTGSAGNNRALVTMPSANYAVETVYSVASATATWLWFRAVDTANFWRVGVGSGLNNTLYVERFVGGASASLTAVTGPVYQSIVAPGDKIRVVCRGRRFRIYVNDTFWQEVQDPSFFTTGVKVGVQGVNAGVAFDYLMVVA